MRRISLSLSLVGLVSLLTFGSFGLASASSDPPIIVPQITAVNSNAICGTIAPCRVIATLTYNTAVGVAGNVTPDFTVKDTTNGQRCTVVAVTTTPPPTPIVLPPVTNALYLTLSCTVKPGDVMVLVYRQNPAVTSGYVYSATNPGVRARTPQTFSWFEGPVPTPVSG